MRQGEEGGWEGAWTRKQRGWEGGVGWEVHRLTSGALLLHAGGAAARPLPPFSATQQTARGEAEGRFFCNRTPAGRTEVSFPCPMLLAARS